MAKDEAYLLAILLPLFLAGCTMPSPGPSSVSTSGVLSSPISGLEPSFSIVGAEKSGNTFIVTGDEFSVNASIKNLGGSDAENVQIKLSLLSGDFRIEQMNWQNIGKLAKKSSTSYLWKVAVAGDRGGELEALLKYRYKTVARGNILVYNFEYANSSKSILQEAQSSRGILSFKGEAAPVMVSVDDTGPFYYKSGKENNITFYVSNGGKGLVYDPEQGSRIRHVRVTIKVGDVYCKNNEDIELNFDDKERKPVYCQFNAATETKTSIPFTVEVSYYYVESFKISVSLKQS